jgi:splicing factor U2AF subunit
LHVTVVARCAQLYDDVYAEASRFGTVTGVAIPAPPPHAPDLTPARVYVRYTTLDASAKCKAAMDGRDFDDRKIKASYVPDEVYYRSAANEWVI